MVYGENDVATISAELLKSLQRKLGVGRTRIYQLIQEQANEQVLSRDLAAISLAMQSGINVHRFATSSQLAEIRHARRGGGSPSGPLASVAQPVPTPTRRIATTRTRKKTGDKRTVLVVYGRNERARKALFDMLRAIGLSPMEFSTLVAKTKKGSPHISDALDAAFVAAQAVVVLFTPDDEAMLKKEFQKHDDPPTERRLTGQPRPNVLFEAGMAFGRIPDKTIVVHVGKIRPFSDVLGRHYIKLTSDEKPKRELARRLKTAGCAVETEGDDWLDDGGAFDVR